MLRFHEIIRPAVADSFFDDTVDLWLGFNAGHMGPQMYLHHNGRREDQPMSGVITWDQHAKHGSIPLLSREAFLSNIRYVASHVGKGFPVIEFGPGSMEDANILIEAIDSKEYIPVDCSLEVIKQARELASSNSECAVTPAVVDFFSEENCPLVDVPALGVLLGLTINNISGPVPKGQPEYELIRAFQNLMKAFSSGGHLLVSTDVCQDGQRNINLYNEPWHKLFGVNHIYRMAEELPMHNFDPNGFEYHPCWHEHCSLLAHTVRATKNQNFEMGDNGEIIVSVKHGDIFHYNNSFKYRPEFFESCAEKAGLEVIRKWQGAGSIWMYLFKIPLATTSKTQKQGFDLVQKQLNISCM